MSSGIKSGNSEGQKLGPYHSIQESLYQTIHGQKVPSTEMNYLSRK